MAQHNLNYVLLCMVAVLVLARPAAAFGAGNIASLSKIEGVNWRHGDIEDVLLTIAAARSMSSRKFGKLDVKRVYFGNWLRDYSQAVDVGTVKHVSAEAIRILLWVLGFMTFGYGTGEFEVTSERLGCYRPEEHIDNPKDYADNVDARQYDRRLRGPVDERRELSINPDTGLKNYIASENLGIDTSAGLVRKLFGECIELGRRFNRNRNKKDLYEALRLLGTGCHCLEDYAAHSNYIELAMIELGERDIFPHVGRGTAVRLRGARHEVWPIVTGTFGGVDFLHSVCGEFDDKTTQSEIQELEGALNNAEQSDGSILQDLLSNIPSGLFGGKDEASKVSELQQNAQAQQMQNARISPREPEEWTRYVEDVQRQIYPIIQWHDEVMQSLTETIEKIPILPDFIENVQDEINKFVFSLLAPYLLPIIRQVQNELQTGSSEIIDSSKNQQHIVFNDDRSSDPTHSMLSKDHFSNVLNEPAGRVASATIKWVVPQLIEAWDDERVDVSRVLNRVVEGVLHHPALREGGGDASEGRRIMFGVVEQWWQSKRRDEQDTLRQQLSRSGVENGENHKPGVHDHGHGSYRPQGQHFGIAGVTNGRQSSGGGDYAIGQTFDAIGNLVGGRADQNYNSSQQHDSSGIGQMANEAVGGGVLGGILGGLASAVGADVLGGGRSEDHEGQTQSYGGRRNDHDSYASQQSNTYSSNRRDEEDSKQQSHSYGSSRHHENGNSYGRQEHQSYGSSQRNDDQDNYERAQRQNYGSTRRDEYNDNDENTHRNNNEDGNEYGRRQQSHRRNDDDDGYSQHTESSTYRQSTQQENYGASGYGGNSYSAPRQEYGSSEYSSERRGDDDGYSSRHTEYNQGESHGQNEAYERSGRNSSHREGYESSSYQESNTRNYGEEEQEERGEYNNHEYGEGEGYDSRRY